MASRVEHLISKRFEALPRGLKDHTHRAQQVARELARQHHVDEEKALLGTLAHDIARGMKGDQLLEKAVELGIPVSLLEKQLPVLLHGPVGAELLHRIDGLDDDEIYQSVCWHTMAHVALPEVAKVAFLADKLDPQKATRYPYLPQLRDMAMESLDQAMLEFLSRELASLLEANSLVHPLSIEARNELLTALGRT